MGDDEVFDAIAELVTAGEYLESIPGLPNVDLDGGGMFLHAEGGALRRVYRRGSRRYRVAKTCGWIDPLPPLTPAPRSTVDEVEALAGKPFPALLRRLYQEVGNGGFGPGYGLRGLRDVGVGEGRLIICDWGCGITTEIDLKDGQIWGCDPNPAPTGISCSFPQHMTITDWFARWLEGRLEQPWLVEDPASSLWRGATDEEYAEVAAEFEDIDDD